MLGLDLIAAHMIGDFILQTNQMATRKFSDVGVRAIHCCVYMLPMMFVANIHAETPWSFGWFCLWVWVTHFIIDSARWASDRYWAPKPILVDQALHLVTLAFLARLL